MMPSQAAREAAGLIAEHGLAKKALQDEEGRFCHNGAIAMAVGGGKWMLFSHPYFEVLQTSQEILAQQGIRLLPHEYSNLDSTSAEDVMLLLKHAAEYLEEKGR
jgi:hypothetical protein